MAKNLRVVAAPEGDGVQSLFHKSLVEMTDALIERDEECKIALTALLCNENCLFVGPPGTAKSVIGNTLCSWLDGQAFVYLLTKYSVPEEVFGPFSLRALKESDQYVRVTIGRLPEADVAFLDEIFKASSAILNTVLTILNERVFDCGDGTRRKVPLKFAIAASNEWPGAGDPQAGKELEALFDRFLFRKAVHPVRSREGEDRLLDPASKLIPELTTRLTPGQLDQARREVAALTWTPEARQGVREILDALKAQGIFPGDRRRVKAVRQAVPAYAYLCGGKAIELEHLTVLQHVLWVDPTEQPEKVASTVQKIANPTLQKVNEQLAICEEVMGKVNWSDPALRGLLELSDRLEPVVRALKGLPKSETRDAALRHVKRCQNRILSAYAERDDGE